MKLRAQGLLGLLVLSAAGSGFRAAAVDVPRWAIAGDAATASHCDLLTVELGRDDRLVVLERAQLEKVAAERSLAAGLGGMVAGARLLGADGLVILSQTEEKEDGTLVVGPHGVVKRPPATEKKGATLEVRFVAVDPGVIVSGAFLPLTGNDLVTIARTIAGRCEELGPKLKVSREDRIPVSFLGFHAPIRTESVTDLERQLNILMARRLMAEEAVFVLERWRMEDALWEKLLKESQNSPFWTGSYLLEGNVRETEAGSGRLRADVKLLSAADPSPRRLEVSGESGNLPALVDSLMRQLDGVLLKRGDRQAAWNALKEGELFAREARWAYRCNRNREVVEAADTAWILGCRTPEIAFLRVLGRCFSLSAAFRQSWRETRGGLFVSGGVSDAETCRRDLGLALDAGEICRETLTSLDAVAASADTVQAGAAVSCLLGGSIVLVDAYELPLAGGDDDPKLARLRRLMRELSDLYVARGLPAPEIVHFLKARYGAMWQEDPAVALRVYRDELRWAGAQPGVMADFVLHALTGAYAGYSHWDGLLPVWDELSDRTSIARPAPPLADWISRDHAGMEAMWAHFLNDLCRSDDAVEKFFGLGIKLRSGTLRPDEIREARDFFWSVRDVIVKQERLTDGLVFLAEHSGREPPAALGRDYNLRYARYAMEEGVRPSLVYALLGREVSREEALDLEPAWRPFTEKTLKRGTPLWRPEHIALISLTFTLNDALPPGPPAPESPAFKLARFWRQPTGPTSLASSRTSAEHPRYSWSTGVRLVSYQQNKIWVVGLDEERPRVYEVDPASLETTRISPRGPFKTGNIRSSHTECMAVGGDYVAFLAEEEVCLYSFKDGTWAKVPVPPKTYTDIIAAGRWLYLGYTAWEEAGPEKAILRVDPVALTYDVVLSSTTLARDPAWSDVEDYLHTFVCRGRGDEVMCGILVNRFRNEAAGNAAASAGQDRPRRRIYRLTPAGWHLEAEARQTYEFIPSGHCLLLGERIGEDVAFVVIPNGSWPEELFAGRDPLSGGDLLATRESDGFLRFMMPGSAVRGYTHKAFDGACLWGLPEWGSGLWRYDPATGTTIEHRLPFGASEDDSQRGDLPMRGHGGRNLAAIPGGLLLLCNDGFWLVRGAEFEAFGRSTARVPAAPPESGAVGDRNATGGVGAK